MGRKGAKRRYNAAFIIKASKQFPELGYKTLADLLGYSYTGTRNAIINAGLKDWFESMTYQNPTSRMSKEALSRRARKIGQAKIRNGTNKHTAATKKLMSESTKKSWDKNPWDCSSKNNTYTYGYLEGIYYRSSYEFHFLVKCFQNGINIASADTKEYWMEYIKPNGRKGVYRPDFVDLDTGAVYEIKPNSMLTLPLNLAKIESAKKHYQTFVVITETDLYDHFL